jgi:hypothetical protein
MTTIATTEAKDSGGKYVMYLFLSSLVLISVFFIIYRDSRRAVEVPVSAVLGEELPGFIDRPSIFRAQGGFIAQLYVPERNLRFHVVVPDSPSEDRTMHSSLLEAVRSYRINGISTPAIDPLLTTFFSAQFDARRAKASGTVPLHIGNLHITGEQIFVEKHDEHFLAGLLRHERHQIGFIAFSVGKPISARDVEGPLTWVIKRFTPAKLKEIAFSTGKDS